MVHFDLLSLKMRSKIDFAVIFIMMAANRTGTGTNRVNPNRVNWFCEPNQSEPEPDFGAEKFKM